MVIAGALIETKPGAQARVAERLIHLPWVALQGDDGDRRLAVVLEGPSGESLEQLTERLLAFDEEILGVFPTFVGDEDDSG
jgi:nitrate reductase NapAB chaperone NapD